MYDFYQISNVLLKRLERQGMQSSIIPGFLKNLGNMLTAHPCMNHWQANKRLHLLGWDDFELDYHTLQLAIAYFETEQLKATDPEPDRRLGLNPVPRANIVNA